MEEGDFSDSSVLSGVTDGQNTTETLTDCISHPKPLVFRLLEVENPFGDKEIEEGEEERQEEDNEHEPSKTRKFLEASTYSKSRKASDSFQSRKASDPPQSRRSSDLPQSRKSSDLPQSRKSSDLPQSRKASDSLQSRKGSSPPQARKVSEPLQSPQVYAEGKGDLLPNAVITTSPSLMARYLPQLQLASLSDYPVSRNFVKKCFFSRRRIEDLSRPKKQWGTPDRLFWGNQDPIRPISETALKAQLTKRLEDLAQPKLVSQHYVPNRAQYYYSCGRQSVIWEIPPPALFTRPSKRIQQLAKPNRFKTQYLLNGDDLAPPGTLHFSAPSPRILQLSIAKGTDPNYVPPKSMETKISFSTLSAVASPRIVDLAHPRIKIEGLCYERVKSELPIRPVSPAALLAKPTSRTITLAKSKPVHEDYLPVRDAQWPVSRAAAHSRVSGRIQELANPPQRASVHVVYYDPDVFKVKPSALKAQCSPRVRELAEPIVRS
ncbi:hypothetical protein HispidOSU_030506 [Sigmodon hispidus]